MEFKVGEVVAFRVAGKWHRGSFVRATAHRVEFKVRGVPHVYFRSSVEDAMVWMEDAA